MNNYEKLQEEAYKDGIDVINYDFKSENIKGLYCDGVIGLNKKIETDAERSGILAEELGHHYTSTGDITNLKDAGNRKQERRARLWSYDRMIGLSGLIRAFEHGCKSKYEIAEYLDVTVEYLVGAIECYRSKYGTHTSVGKYEIYFIPTLSVLKMF